MKIAIIGLGYSAGFFARAAQAEGHEIIGTVRSPGKAQALTQAGLPAIVFDGSTVSPELKAAVNGAEAVLVSTQPAGDVDPALACLGEALASAPALGWIGYLSTIGVYGDHGGDWIDETASCRSAEGRARTRLGIDMSWLAFGERSGKPVHIFRLSGIYGPGRNAIVNLREGKARRLVKPGQVFNRIHAADIAGVLLASMQRPRAGAIYNVSDDEPAPPQDVVSYAAALIGVTPPPEIPYDPAQLSPMAASFYSQNKRVSNALVKRELGYAFRYSTYREALTALAAEGE
jgi:nucleoside-diphosphate-sugar epimerase